MFFNLLVLAMVGGISVAWMLQGKGRGMFSSFINALCVVISGAIAFGVWELVVYNLLLGIQEDIAWGLGLSGSFVVALVATRVLTEWAIPKNLDLPDAANFVGGAAFGVVAAVVTSGIVVISLLSIRGAPELLGYKAIKDERGSLTYATSLWVPVDKITVKIYEHMSLGSFATGTPMAERHPALHEHVAMQRMTYFAEGQKGNAVGRTTFVDGDFEVKGRYTVDGPPRVEGFVVEFQSGAKEKRTGQVVIGPGQVRLIGERNGEPFVAHPNSIVAQPDASVGGVHRFPMDASGMFVPSVGGAASSAFAFEFAVPAGVTVSDLVLKNFRVPVASDSTLRQAGVAFASRADGDGAISSGDLFEDLGLSVGGLKVADLDDSDAEVIRKGTEEARTIQSTIRMPDGWIINTTTGTGGLQTRGNAIEGGEHTFAKEQLEGRGIDRKLQVNEFATTSDTGIIQLQLARNDKQSLLGKAFQSAEATLPPLIIDTDGNAYQAVGYMYSDGRTVKIRYKPGEPIRALSQVPQVSSAKRDQTLYLVFRPTKDVEIKSFSLGNRVIATYDPPVRVR